MSQSVGPILAIGAITFANESIVQSKPPDPRVFVATGIAAGVFTLAEKAWPKPVTMLAYAALVTVLFVRVNPSVPAPVESFTKWWNEGRK